VAHIRRELRAIHGTLDVVMYSHPRTLVAEAIAVRDAMTRTALNLSGVCLLILATVICCLLFQHLHAVGTLFARLREYSAPLDRNTMDLLRPLLEGLHPDRILWWRDTVGISHSLLSALNDNRQPAPWPGR
jgi:hypothetical protein